MHFHTDRLIVWDIPDWCISSSVQQTINIQNWIEFEGGIYKHNAVFYYYYAVHTGKHRWVSFELQSKNKAAATYR